jgi:glycosyltransferase EpsE
VKEKQDTFDTNHERGATMATVSVIMGIYNCADTLPQCVDSILAQTYSDWELIMCDDCSKDDTYDIASQYAQKYSNIIALRNEKNYKLAYTLNKCLAYANGKYIARMDADDISLPTRFEKQVAFLDGHSEYHVVGSSVIVFDETGDKLIRKSMEHPVKECLKKTVPFTHPTIMMRKEVYDALDGYQVLKRTNRCEDRDLWFRFFAEGFGGYNIQEPLLKYHESLSDYKKRNLKSAWQGAQTRLYGYRLLHFPLSDYPYLARPIISALVPDKIMYYYQKNIRGKR